MVNLLVDIIDIFNEALVAVFGIFMVFLKRAVDGILPPARVATTVSAALGIGLFFYVHITGDIPNTLISLTPGRTGDYLQASTTVFLPIVTGAFHLAEDAWATGLFFGALLGLIGGLLIALAPAKRRKHMRKVVREALRLFKMMWSAGWFKSTVRAMSLEVFTTHAS
ncbi:MAG: hypothetical protein JRM77_08990 [Nitrososphaerota archaeon]|nr:hypothetical protein [Nitrososphaerota archaeon]